MGEKETHVILSTIKTYFFQNGLAEKIDFSLFSSLVWPVVQVG